MRTGRLLAACAVAVVAMAASARANLTVEYAGIYDVGDDEYVASGYAVAGTAVNFGAVATDGCSGDPTYTWDFDPYGDHDISTSQFPSRIYSSLAGGLNYVKLTITGISDTVVRWFIVYVISDIQITEIGGTAVPPGGAVGDYKMSFNDTNTVKGRVLPETLGLNGRLDWKLRIGAFDIIKLNAAGPTMDLPVGNWPSTNDPWGLDAANPLICALNDNATFPGEGGEFVNGVVLTKTASIKRFFGRSTFENGKSNPAQFGSHAWPNWFCYWRRTSAFYSNDVAPVAHDLRQPLYLDPAPGLRATGMNADSLDGEWSEGGSTTVAAGLCRYEAGQINQWRSYVTEAAQESKPFDGEGIDFFAIVCRHEETHRSQFSGLWNGGPRVALLDADGDMLPDLAEPNLQEPFGTTPLLADCLIPTNPPLAQAFPAPGLVRGYNAAAIATFYDRWAYWGGNPANPISLNEPLIDCEDYCEMWSREIVYNQNWNDDWAHPGKQWE